MQRSTFAGTTGVAVGTAGTGEEVVGDLGWYPSDGCAGFPPSRERRGGGARTTSYAKVYLRGNDVGEARGRRVMQRSTFAGTTWGRREDDELCNGLPSRERQEWPWGRRERARRLLATLVGIRVTVALGSRLRGNDVGEAQGRRVMQRSTFAGTTWGRRKDDELCKGLPSRERQEWPWGRRERARRLLATLVGIRVTVALGSRLRGNDVEEAQGRRVMQRSTFAGTTWGRRKDDELCKGLLSRERQEWPWGRRERARRLLATLVGIRVTVALGSRLRGNDVGEAQGRRVMQRSTFAGTTWGRLRNDELVLIYDYPLCSGIIVRVTCRLTSYRSRGQSL